MSKPPNDHPTAPPPDSTLPPLPKHTPEPWEIKDDPRIAIEIWSGNLLVALIPHLGNVLPPIEERRANAALIRLSPRLARALGRLAACIKIPAGETGQALFARPDDEVQAAYLETLDLLYELKQAGAL